MMASSFYKNVAYWLFFVTILVIIMIVVGGATRLTNSGLSITEWKPIKGALPPISAQDWALEFEKYKQIPEFEAEHPDMDLAGFKFIYFWEWIHRQLGRIIGLAYALPLIWFSLKKTLKPGYFLSYITIFFLIGLQGLMGWWMVSSGLVNDRVDVSQYRLAAHLGMAFIILGLLYNLWLSHAEKWQPKGYKPVLVKRSLVLFVLVFLQIIAGAFVAGTHSGKSYNTWPAMDGGFVPNGYSVMSPSWKNLFENTAAIQFNHRVLAYAILALTLILLISAFRKNALKGPVTVFAILILWQSILGIWTLLAIAPLSLSLLHQFSSIIVFLSALWLFRSARRGY